VKEEGRPGETQGIKEARCHRCHRHLSDAVSVLRGYGKVCWAKKYRQPELFEETPCDSK